MPENFAPSLSGTPLRYHFMLTALDTLVEIWAEAAPSTARISDGKDAMVSVGQTVMNPGRFSFSVPSP